MTHPTRTTVIAVFTRVSGLRAWTLVTDPGWNPARTDNLDADLRTYQFTDADFDVTATIMMFGVDGTGRIREGYLIPTPGRCPLCDDRRSITVRHYPDDASATGDLILRTLISWGEDAAARIGMVDQAKPCPACCLADYLLTADNHPTGGPR
jgi:hypothetical protein